MPSIYDFRHVELDKVGRGKRIIKAPGGGENNIFGQSGDNQPMNGNGKANGNGSISETESVDGSVISCPSTPVHNGNGNGSQFGYESDTSSTISSTTSSRRGSLQDTKNRLFGQPEGLESPRRRVVDRMKSNIFAEPEPAPVVRSPSVKKYEHVIRRNPITGEVLEEQQQQLQHQQPTSNGNGNATVNMNGSMNGSNGSASMPNTPVRVRQPPGGKTSNIFG
ncbi:uncharacterized protein LOC113791781 isoform X1 [Dermatophagoides pteronyssinus]|uniref:Microtubule-associated protein Jupiter-like isoform X1 n=1 Tax=Dermatophagoides pteronyssinus TaxID=6956 RepID=A0A6P6XVG3_DERPT|nr:microtubule-associated protein Jupiter-like isoform X1 [Dermatophagoides pteronyssinus]